MSSARHRHWQDKKILYDFQHHIQVLHSQSNSLYNKYENLCNDILDNPQDIDLLIPLALTNMMEDIKLEEKR